MDMVIITCPKCGHSESFPHPESVPVRNQCPGCAAKESCGDGATYQSNETVSRLSEKIEDKSPRRSELSELADKVNRTTVLKAPPRRIP